MRGVLGVESGVKVVWEGCVGGVQPQKTQKTQN